MNLTKITKEEYYNLLKKVYVDEMKWDFSSSNISNLYIEKGMLLDDFSDDALFYGFCWDEEPVFGFRLVPKSAEIERFSSNKDFNSYLNSSLEINRLVIDQKVRKKGLVKLVAKIAFEYCKAHNIRYCTTASDNKNLNKKYKKVPGVKVYEQSIQYPEGPCNAYLFDTHHWLFRLSQTDMAVFRGKKKKVMREVYEVMR